MREQTLTYPDNIDIQTFLVKNWDKIGYVGRTFNFSGVNFSTTAGDLVVDFGGTTATLLAPLSPTSASMIVPKGASTPVICFSKWKIPNSQRRNLISILCG